MAKKDEEPNAEEIFGNKYEKVRDLLAQRSALSSKAAQIKEEIKDITDRVFAFLTKRGVDRPVIFESGLRCTIVGGKTRRLDPKLLMKHGVTAAVIAKSTVEVERAKYLKITDPGSDERGEDDGE